MKNRLVSVVIVDDWNPAKKGAVFEKEPENNVEKIGDMNQFWMASFIGFSRRELKLNFDKNDW